MGDGALPRELQYYYHKRWTAEHRKPQRVKLRLQGIGAPGLKTCCHIWALDGREW
jgi:hypothetical protein